MASKCQGICLSVCPSICFSVSTRACLLVCLSSMQTGRHAWRHAYVCLLVCMFRLQISQFNVSVMQDIRTAALLVTHRPGSQFSSVECVSEQANALDHSLFHSFIQAISIARQRLFKSTTSHRLAQGPYT